MRASDRENRPITMQGESRVNNLLIHGITIDWSKVDSGSYLRKIPAIGGLECLEFHRPVTFFAGENGSGKSSLLEAIAIACGFNPEGGTKNYSFSTYDSHSDLHQAVTVHRGYRQVRWGYFFRAESFYNVATKEREYADLLHPSAGYHEKSHGESFHALMQNQLRSNGLYLFDEPEAALSPQRQMTLLMEIDQCAREGSQFVIATHSPILLGLPDAEILTFDQGPVHRCTYEETTAYEVMELFMNHREQMLNRLLGRNGERAAGESREEKSHGKKDHMERKDGNL